ncbi:class I SAM-dependent DNA methyltransferase [Virgibacillus soli]|uniref:Class I SAM-dependent methyltransferase n=1 Tax=Paracerasibacillus soli TaxID=480284 RepID=A0ABU5CQ46_9BACI|nr:class I SAM-dependent methyltransferase [Virgibacillus soli]MDY0408501.1 class I SAM-dependent methyltransferase [Virgibacillus soli]
MSAYEDLAYVYDTYMLHAPYDKWFMFSKQCFGLFSSGIDNIIDLGCGTGEIANRLAADNYAVTGVDYSEEMLAIAQQKAADKAVNIQWLHQDMRELVGLTNYDAVVSFCDVLNYVTSIEDVQQVFEQVNQSLKVDGLFIFDVHALDYVEHHLIDQTFADVDTNNAYIWFCTPGDNEGEMFHDLTFFMEQDGVYKRFDETHHQRTFSIQTYEKLLKQTNFELIHICADFSLDKEVDNESERIFFIAKKRS